MALATYPSKRGRVALARNAMFQPLFLRRLLQFRLRTLMLAVFVVATYLGWQIFYENSFDAMAPVDWDVGTQDRRTILSGVGVPVGSRHIKWSAPLGSVTNGSPVVSGGKVFVGTNNTHGYLARYPRDHDLGILLCLNANDGKFLWQASSEKLSTGRAQDLPMSGITSTPLVERDRLWYVTNRGEVACLDTEGFYDGQNDGAVQNEIRGEHEADVVWSFDMLAELGVSPHEMSPCRPATDGQRLFIVTGNGVDQGHRKIPAPNAPSFLALDKRTGEVLWTDNSPGANILHAQWGSPTYAVLGGVPQAIFPGGDGWIYSFDPAGTPQGMPKLLWKFDLNPKDTTYEIGSRSTKNESAFFVAVSGNRVYAAAGNDPEHGEGTSVLWCIDSTRRGDVSEELVFNRSNPNVPVPAGRDRALDVTVGDYSVPNPHSAVIWQYRDFDGDGNGVINPLLETMHRTRGGIAIQNGVLIVADIVGIVHCLNADTGQVRWTYDMQFACWNSPLISGPHAYVCDEDGDVSVFRLFSNATGAAPPNTPIAATNMGNSIYTTPTVSQRVLYIATRNRLFAIEHKQN